MEYLHTPELIQKRLRALRLWHWKQAMACRTSAQQYAEMIDEGWGDAAANSMRCDDLNARANEHIFHVQTLNDFFPVDDTAEKDAAHEDDGRKQTP